MLKTNASLEQIVREVIEQLRERIAVNKLILFGSYNEGNPRPDSDFDIAVISNDFESMSLWDRMGLFAKIAVAVDSRLELLGFSLKEFEHPEKSSFLAMIKREGRCVFEEGK